MRLAFVISCLEMGGAQRVAINLIREWVARGWSITLVVTYSGRGTCYYEVPEAVDVVYLADLVQPSRCGRIQGLVRRTLALRRLLKSRRPDRVISFLSDANLIALAASWGLGLPLIVSERNYPPADVIPPIYASARLFAYPFATQVVMQTRRGLNWLSRSIPSARGAAIPNPIVLPLSASGPPLDPDTVLASETRLLLGVGRLVHQKGFDVLIEAFGQVAQRHTDWELVIVGDGADRGALERQIDQCGLADRVRLVGAAGNIGDWYARADIFVLASRFEGFPNTLLEAMAYGCASISFDCDTGPADMIVSGQNGELLGPTPNAGELAAALMALMADEPRREMLACGARDVQVRFSMGAVLSQWDAALGITQSGEGQAFPV